MTVSPMIRGFSAVSMGRSQNDRCEPFSKTANRLGLAVEYYFGWRSPPYCLLRSFIGSERCLPTTHPLPLVRSAIQAYYGC